MRFALGAACALLLAACSLLGPTPDAEVLTLHVEPQRISCNGFSTHSCLLVRTEPDTAYAPFFDHIAGFEHEAGVRYVLRVARREVDDPPLDGSRYLYRLLAVVERQRAEAPDAAPVSRRPAPTR